MQAIDADRTAPVKTVAGVAGRRRPCPVPRSSGSATTCASRTTRRCAPPLERGEPVIGALRARRGVVPASARSAGRRAGGCTTRLAVARRTSCAERGGAPGAAARGRPIAWCREVGDGCRGRRRLLEPALRRGRARDRRRAQVRAPRGRRRGVVVSPARCCSSRGRCTTGAGTPFSVFTPFWRAWLRAPRAARTAARAARASAGRARAPACDCPRRLGAAARPGPDWAGGLRETWEPGEPAARRAAARVPRRRPRATTTARGTSPPAGATSLLSPRLRWGELSPHTVWHETVAAGAARRQFPHRARVARVRLARARSTTPTSRRATCGPSSTRSRGRG